MEEIKSTPKLFAAVIEVMKAVEGIDKSMTVGAGQSAYKGVSDKDVKQIIGREMAKHGLCILPIGVEESTQIDRWEETSGSYSKQKQSVLSRVTTKYLLCHTSGETQVLSGYGHGADSQDKAAGKATTYALKYTLLYTFLVQTGKIDDADNEHSEEKEVPPKKDNKPLLTDSVLKNMETAYFEQGKVDLVKTRLATYSIPTELQERASKLK